MSLLCVVFFDVLYTTSRWKVSSRVDVVTSIQWAFDQANIDSL